MKQICWGGCQHCQDFAKAKPRLRQLTKFLTLIVVGEKAGVGAINEPSPELVKLVGEGANTRDVIGAGEHLKCRDDRHVWRNHALQHRLIDSPRDLRRMSQTVYAGVDCHFRSLKV